MATPSFFLSVEGAARNFIRVFTRIIHIHIISLYLKTTSTSWHLRASPPLQVHTDFTLSMFVAPFSHTDISDPPFLHVLMWLISLYVKTLPLLPPSPPRQTLRHPTRVVTLCTRLPPSSVCLYADTHTQGYPDMQKPPLPSLSSDTPWWTALLTSLALPWHGDGPLSLLRFCHPAFGSSFTLLFPSGLRHPA